MHQKSTKIRDPVSVARGREKYSLDHRNQASFCEWVGMFKGARMSEVELLLAIRILRAHTAIRHCITKQFTKNY